MPVEDFDQATEDFDKQEAAFAAAAAAPPSAVGADRPLTGAKPPPTPSSASVVAEDRPLSGAAGGRSMRSSGSAFDLEDGVGGVDTGSAAPGGGGGSSGGVGDADSLASTSEVEPAAAAKAKPWLRRRKAPPPRATKTAVDSAEGDGEGAAEEEEVKVAAPAKPWLKKRRPVADRAAPAVGVGEVEGDVVAAAPAKPWKTATAAAAEVVAEGGGGVAGDGGEGGGGVQNLEACLKERDWKKRVAAFEVFLSGESGTLYQRAMFMLLMWSSAPVCGGFVGLSWWMGPRVGAMSFLMFLIPLSFLGFLFPDARLFLRGVWVRRVFFWMPGSVVCLDVLTGPDNARDVLLFGLLSCVCVFSCFAFVMFAAPVTICLQEASRACRRGDQGAVGTVGPLLPRMLQDNNVQVIRRALQA